MDRGRLVADGTPAEVLSPALLAGVFHIHAHFSETPEGYIFQSLGIVDRG